MAWPSPIRPIFWTMCACVCTFIKYSCTFLLHNKIYLLPIKKKKGVHAKWSHVECLCHSLMLYERDSISYQNHWSLLPIFCSWRVIFIEIKAFLYDKKSNFLEIAQVNISFTQKGRIPTCEYPIHDIYFNHELVQKSRFFYQKNETKQVFAPKEWNRRVEFWVIAGEY